MKSNIGIDHLQQLIKCYGIYSDLKQVLLPKAGGPPVEILPIIPDAFACDIDQCEHVTLKRESMLAHVHKAHPNHP